VEGRQYPVDVLYTPEPEEDYIDGVLVTILQIHIYEKAGDILVFLTGQDEIDTMEQILKRKIPLLPPESLQVSFIA